MIPFTVLVLGTEMRRDGRIQGLLERIALEESGGSKKMEDVVEVER